MESVTDPKVVISASQLRVFVYVQLSMLTLLVHDWLTSLDREVEHVWRGEWSIPKALFFISRYAIFLDTTIMITLYIAPYDTINYDTCLTLYKITAWSYYIGVAISESILLLRTIAIYSRSRLVTAPLSVTYMLGTVAGAILTWYDIHTTVSSQPPSALFAGYCYTQSGSVNPYPRFLILLVFQLVIVILTIRSALDGPFLETPLLKVLYRDSVAFFLGLFAVTLTTILVQILGPPQFRLLMVLPFRVAHSIVCCRIILNLRRAAIPRGASTWASISLAFAAAPGEQANGTETIRSEVYGEQNDGRDSYP